MSTQQQPIFSVSECNEMLNLHLARLGEIIVEGEISEIKVSKNSWLFITIKDEYAHVDVFAVIYQISGWKALEEGMKVHVYGVPGLYLKSGRFSLRADRIVPAGDGALKAAFERLKRQLEHEGLFDQARKRSLPRFPERIGLITAKHSQAYNDFTKVLGERMGGLHIYFAPVSVQGADATASLINALAFFSANGNHCDVLVLCRGGGSTQDLHAFNDEHVARAIFACPIPTIVGVGHEGDVSLADLVADVRASTPTQAAELVVADKTTLTNQVDAYIRIMTTHMKGNLSQQLMHVATLEAALSTATTGAISNIKRRLEGSLHTFTSYAKHLSFTSDLLDQMTARASRAIQVHLQQARGVLEKQEQLLHAYDYHTTLNRGFSITRTEDGTIVRSQESAKEGTQLTTTIRDGTIYSRVTKPQPKKKYA